jgi:D-glycero-D-manno-heptose 1,7-bisphosphate phosphatase
MGFAREHKLVVLDRDGTLNAEPEDFLRTPEDWQPLPGALEAVARLHHGGWRLVIASNQSGIGRGLFDVALLNAVHARMHKLVATAGGRIEAVFFCPHAPEEACECRKPAPGLLQQIALRTAVPLSQMVVVGDSLRDMQAALAVGAQAHLVLTGQSAAGRPASLPDGVGVHPDLSAFADALLNRPQRNPV